MPSSGVWPFEMGESWFAVETTWGPLPSCTSHVQPEPKRLTPASLTAVFSASRPPKLEPSASPREPDGLPPPFGPMISQKRVWFAWPPTLFRTAARLSSGMSSRSERIASTGRSAHSVPSSALFALSTYAWWCLSWWTRIVCSSMCGSSALESYGRDGTSKAIGRSFIESTARICSPAMASLAFKFEEITPRELKPELHELDGISRATIKAHYKLYEGYINKRNEILRKLDGVDTASANQVYSDLRALKVDLTFAIGGIKNHEIYFEHLGGGGGDPDGMIGDLIERDFGSLQAWRTDLKATGMAGRGWAWTAYDWDEGRLFTYVGDAQNTFPIWNATPLIALDVYEHAYFLDYQTDRASYIDAFFDNLDWSTVNDWVSKYQIQT